MIDYFRNVNKEIVNSTMQEDVFPAAEKILSDIENVLKKDPNLWVYYIVIVFIEGGVFKKSYQNFWMNNNYKNIYNL